MGFARVPVKLAALLTGLLLLPGCASSTPAVPAGTPLAWTDGMALQAQDPVVAVDSRGWAVAAWCQTAADNTLQVRAQWLVAGSAPQALSEPSQDAVQPALAADAAGGVQLLWLQNDPGPRAHVWGCSWNGSAWTQAVQISSNTLADAGPPRVACAAAGHALALWHEGNGAANHFDVHGSGFAGGSWAAPTLVSDGVHSAFNPQVSMNAAGQAVGAWTQAEDDGSLSNGPQDTWAALAAAGAWSTPLQLNVLPGSSASVYGEVAAAMDASGQAVVLWIQAGSGAAFAFQTWACGYAPGSGWGTPSAISLPSAGGDAYGPDLALDGAGHAEAVWQQGNGTAAAIAASRLTLGGAWGPVQTLSAWGSAADPHVAFGAAGAATAVWYEQDVTGSSVRSATGSGAAWGAPALVDSPAISGLQYPVPQLAGNPAGAPVLVWGVDSD